MQPRLTKNYNLMKKILFAIAFIMVLGFGANAQSDSFFKSDNSNAGSGNRDGESFGMALPSHGATDDQQAPLGSGMLILTAMGAGYAIARRRK